MSQPIRAVITGNMLVNEHTEYRVELCAGAAKLSSVSRRFREFTELHAQLSKFNHAFPIPDVPPKKFFGRTNPEFVAKRQHELQTFLDQLVNNIVANPPAEAAWRLLCLFLALDPKQYVPESILNLADQSTSGAPIDIGVGGAGGVPRGVTGHVGSLASSSVDASAGHNTYNSYGSASMLGAAGVGDPGGENDPQSLEAEEKRRMDNIVDQFARVIINVSKHEEERLQQPSAAMIAHLPLDKLKQALDTHILSEPFATGAQVQQQQQDGDGTGGEHALTAKKTEILGVEDIVIKLDKE